MELLKFYPGGLPLLISMPHNGTLIPDELRHNYTVAGLRVEDTDWYMDKLYSFCNELGCATLQPLLSRYVIDLNRSPQNEELYPGKATTGLCPVKTFSDEDIYISGQPTKTEIEQRIKKYYQPYHQKITSWIQSCIDQFNIAVIYEAHSIKSHVPKLFQGKLPALNLGTNDGLSCATQLEKIVWNRIQTSHYSAVKNKRFKGGYITRQYGKPIQGVHTLQMEISQCHYLNEDTNQICPDRFQDLQAFLKTLISSIITWIQDHD